MENKDQNLRSNSWWFSFDPYPISCSVDFQKSPGKMCQANHTKKKQSKSLTAGNRKKLLGYPKFVCWIQKNRPNHSPSRLFSFHSLVHSAPRWRVQSHVPFSPNFMAKMSLSPLLLCPSKPPQRRVARPAGGAHQGSTFGLAQDRHSPLLGGMTPGFKSTLK